MTMHSFICNACVYFNPKTNEELDVAKCENCKGQGKEWQPRNAEFYERYPQKFWKCLLLGLQ